MHGMFQRMIASIKTLVSRVLNQAGSIGRRIRLPRLPAAGSLRKYLKIRYILLGGSLGMVVLCSILYFSVRSYAPVAAREGAPTLTPTPFLPATSTSTPFGPEGQTTPTEPPIAVSPLRTPTLPGDSPPWAPYAGPIYPPLIEVPKPVEEFKTSSDILNIALLGSDVRPAGGSFNTDTIMILTLNRTKKTAALISFPRDLYVYIPAYGMERINAAFGEGMRLNYPGGGFGLFQDTMRYNFGLTIDHYALMDFSGFQALINTLGGIDVYSQYGLTDKRQGMGTFSIDAGWHHMDGEMALWYVRARKTTSDFDRVRRQQEVILGIAQTLLNKNALSNIPGFFVTLANFVESDLTLDAVTPFADIATSVSISSITRTTLIPDAYGENWITPDGKMVVLPNYDAIHTLLDGILNS
jgi:polyisoprenyl-teichoic acid--peptidoglycan teichoic acid transferase